MITKVIQKYIDTLLNVYIQHGIQLTAKFTPNVDNLDSYSYENLFSHSATSNTPYQYRGVLLYTIDSPIRPNDRYRNTRWGVFQQSGHSEPQSYDMSPWKEILTPNPGQSEFYIGKTQNWEPDTKEATTRPVSFLEVPVRVKIATESLSTAYDIYLLALQNVYYLNEVIVPVDLENDGNTKDVEYWLSFEDYNETQVQHLPEQENNLIHTVAINAKLTGGYYSNFYRSEKTIQKVQTNLDVNSKDISIIPHRPFIP